MTTSDGRALIDAGWVQGVTFDAPGASYDLNAPAGSAALGRIQPRTIRHQSGECLVLISHACDIQAEDEKYVETLICQQHDPNSPVVRRWDQNSPQRFLIDPTTGYVADARHRIKVAKPALLTMVHHGQLMDEERLYRFVEWLTRRYDRPTVPDHIHDLFHRPVHQALNRLDDEDGGFWEQFNRAVNEIRVTLPTEMSPPYSIGVVYLTASSLSVEQADAIDDVHQVIRQAAHEEIHVPERPVVIELDEVPFKVMRRTQPLIIEYPSWGDDETAQPPWAQR